MRSLYSLSKRTVSLFTLSGLLLVSCMNRQTALLKKTISNDQLKNTSLVQSAHYLISPHPEPTRLSQSVGENTALNQEYLIASEGDQFMISGVLTAAEVNDFSKWDVWPNVKNVNLAFEAIKWGIHPKDRFTIQLVNENQKPLIDVPVYLKQGDSVVLWKARTDNTGKAELWSSLYEEQKAPTAIEAVIDGVTYTLNDLKPFRNGINRLEISHICNPPSAIDILFMVDGTRSMEDEISYLKRELFDVLSKTKRLNNEEVDLRVGSLFYRCKKSSYVTRKQGFTSDLSAVRNFINLQEAAEGGDEVVDIALAKAVNKFDWSEEARVRLLFIVLDEPPGIDKAQDLRKSIKTAAEKGIRIVPIIASGTELKANNFLEYLTRSMALATNGTCAFITDHSGLGLPHKEPFTNEYDVEQLNDLILRIIEQYSYVPPCDDDQKVYKIYPIDSLQVKITETTPMRIEQPPSVVLDLRQEYPKVKNPIQTTTAFLEIEPSSVSPDLKASFKFYPNPTTGTITVELNDIQSNLFLLDMSGKVLEQIHIAGRNELDVDLSRYPDGFYSIGYRSGNKWFSGKVLLIH